MEVRKPCQSGVAFRRNRGKPTKSPESWYILKALSCSCGEWMTTEGVIGAVWDLNPLMQKFTRRFMWFWRLMSMSRGGMVDCRSHRKDRRWRINDRGLEALDRSPVPRIELLKERIV